MKTKILIVEEEYCRYFTTKQLLQSQLRVQVEVQTAQDSDELIRQTAEMAPNVLIYRPLGGVVEILETLKLKGINRRNAIVTIVLTHELDAEACRKMFEVAHKKPATHLPMMARAA